MNPFDVLRSFLVSLTITAYIVIAIESPSRLSTCHPDQREALSRFNRSFSILATTPSYLIDSCMSTSFPKTASWREDDDCCSWEGVTCDNSTGDIIGLDLSCARLLGNIDPNSSLFSLRHLRSLSLAENNLIGVIPTEISQLSKLVSLDLSYNGLEVQDPTMRLLVKNLTQLEDLDLTWVNMSAVIPTSLMNFSSSLISLQLPGCSLGGKFPDYILQLPNIQTLNLNANFNLHGTLPESNWSSSLAFLSLSYCSFNGVVPNSIGTLTQLTSLDLSGNNFTGHVDFRTFSTLKNLRSLRLSGVSVSGEDATDANPKFPKLDALDISFGMLNNFPCFLAGMPELRELSLSWNIVSEFPGQCVIGDLSFPQLQTLYMTSCNLTKFPSFLSQSNKLRILHLMENRIEEIPSWFWGIGIDSLEELTLADNLVRGGLRLPWKRLSLLFLQNNSFVGPLPIPTSPFISEFYLSQNRLNGSIPLSICQLTHLHDLALSQNNLTGVIPQCLSNLTDLRSLDLSSNSLTGPLPPCLSNLSDLWYLDLSNNSLTGPLPLTSYGTKYYSVSNNNFSGKISSLLCNATNLQFLDMSRNGLTGTLPQCLKTVTIQLHFLNLRANGFQGSIPEIFSEGCNLTSIDFSRNQFGGSLPRSLSNCKMLEALDVGSNKIEDSFPDWLVDLPLKVLSLRSNKLHGPVSISKGTHPLSTIRVLDLSNNSFEGNLQDNLIDEMFDMRLGRNAGYMVSSFSSISAAGVYEPLFSVMIDLKGVETELVKINVQFATLDLSSNRFCGEIPRNIGLLKSLRGLNFSHNCFTGTIPPSVRNLTNLESLDLSSNYLVGGIPRELAQLTFLGALDLSQNNLTGPIPLGGHFNTFPNSSFDGNPGLCGIPLTRACSQEHAESQTPQNRGDSGEDEAGGWLEWKFVAMGFGSGLGIGISLGYMALEIGKPLWLARMVI